MQMSAASTATVGARMAAPDPDRTLTRALTPSSSRRVESCEWHGPWCFLRRKSRPTASVLLIICADIIVCTSTTRAQNRGFADRSANSSHMIYGLPSTAGVGMTAWLIRDGSSFSKSASSIDENPCCERKAREAQGSHHQY